MLDLLCRTDVSTSPGHPTWDPSHSFDWNYLHGPLLNNLPAEPLPQQSIAFLSWQLRSPLGIAAGPLPNSKFVKEYARLGYSLLTYKSVRSCAYDPHPQPILARLRSVGQVDPLAPTPLI